jgi:cyclophilin family peptidyl-prolyl cis-trans isomerase
MKIGILAVGVLVSAALSVAAYGDIAGLDKNSLQARLMTATDARDAENPVFDEALKAGKYQALERLGQIGGEACKRLIPYLRGINAEAKQWAAKGAVHCYDKSLAVLLAEGLASAEDKAPWAAALGFSTAEDAPDTLAAVLATIGGDKANQRALLVGLLQSVVYTPMRAVNISGLDMPQLLESAHRGANSDAAAYVLARLQNVPDALPWDAFAAILGDQLSTVPGLSINELEATRLLTRLAREYGDTSVPLLLAAYETKPGPIRLEAIRSLGYLSDAKTKSLLLGLASGEGDTASRYLAIEALGRRSGEDPDLVAVLELYVSDENRWVASTALRWLGKRDPFAANEIAADWLEGGDYYLAFQALTALTGSDEGKAVLRAYAAANPKTVRGFEAAVALDPSLEARAKPRKTPDWSLVQAYQNRELILETTRGKVCITMTGDAPYAATSFLQLADYGKMDGMLWHRVIPNFVAQAGQIENKELAKWGSIREEWGGEHRIGSVGVATAGRDTGTTQFFINTAHNIHLTGRYTVFGEVFGGMDVVFALEEGDVIKQARTVKAPSANCK